MPLIKIRGWVEASASNVEVLEDSANAVTADHIE
jgi:hypothetical protein